ncbi:MAG: hypothetical protein PVI23_15545 [Maricaulaceae bacterium]|jgi:hypothetical protein
MIISTRARLLRCAFAIPLALGFAACDAAPSDSGSTETAPAPAEPAQAASAQTEPAGQVASIAAPTPQDEIAYQAALNGRWDDELEGCDESTWVFRPGTLTTADGMTCSTHFTHINRGVASVDLDCGGEPGVLELRFTHWPRTDRLSVSSTSGTIARTGLQVCE